VDAAGGRVGLSGTELAEAPINAAPSSDRRTAMDSGVKETPAGGANEKLWRPLPSPARSRSSR
jgi:hypothetical protein